MTENYRYYEGLEEEPEYTFCLYDGNCPIEKIHIWEGYFRDIIRTVAPVQNGWTSLAEYYHTCIDFDNENWKIPDIKSALQQLKNIDTSKIIFSESYEILSLLVEMLTKADENNQAVYIEHL